MRISTVAGSAVAAFLTLFPSAASSAASPTAGFKAALERALDADASWTMVKSVENTPFKFRFEGVVSCAKGKGVVWSMERPLRTKITMSESGMKFSGDGKGCRETPSSELPHYREIKKAIDAFLDGGELPLEKLFELASEESGGRWRVELTPRRSDMRRMVKSVSVSGSETVEKVEFRYASGENACIDFRETARGVHSLWKEGE